MLESAVFVSSQSVRSVAAASTAAAFSFFAVSLLASCGSTVRSVTASPLGLQTPRLSAGFSGLTVHSDIEGYHVPPRAPDIKAGSRVVLSFVACERHSEEWGPPVWSCHADDAEQTPEEHLVIERAAACFDLERSEASRDILAALAADRWQAPPTTAEVHLVFVRRTQINRTKEVRPIGCEAAVGQPCDPVSAEATGRTLEQVSRSRNVLIIGPGAPADPYLRAWPFPAWRADVSYANVETPELSFAPGDTLTDAQARGWLERLSKIDETTASRTVRLSILWDRAVLAFKMGDVARGERALAAAERELAPEPSREEVDRKIVVGAPTLHALLDGTVSLADPCRRR
jgi:hypothetical protein